uniref:SH2 domain-containing protein n=1 Tax=Meloidogyne javanica TaxID=6303 RepID=A0A915NDU6_MELJA
MTHHYTQFGIIEQPQQNSPHNIVPFDPYNWENFFFGLIDRNDAEALLKGTEVGTFLMRESTSEEGYSLSVKETNDRVNHYLIKREQQEDGKQRFVISNNVVFVDIPSLLSHYKLRKLDSTPLIFPLGRPSIEKVIGSNCLGNTGLIPANYVKIYEEGDEISLQNLSSKSSGSTGKRYSANSVESNNNLTTNSWVRVIADRCPSIYDVAALSIRQGQLLWVQELLSNGMCKGANEDGKAGLFPITYVEPVGVTPEAAMPAIDHSSTQFLS